MEFLIGIILILIFATLSMINHNICEIWIRLKEYLEEMNK